MSLIRVESRKYVSMMWTVDPDKTGIKANAILVKDMPLLTTAPAPKKFEQLNTGSVKDILKVKQSVRGSVRKLDKIFDDEEVGCVGRLKLLTQRWHRAIRRRFRQASAFIQGGVDEPSHQQV